MWASFWPGNTAGPAAHPPEEASMRLSPRRPGILFAVALPLGLLIPPWALTPSPAAAQGTGAQLVIERPDAGSTVRGNVVVGGFAVDPTSPNGTGIAPDSVQVWLGPAGSGRLLETAGYGDP